MQEFPHFYALCKTIGRVKGDYRPIPSFTPMNAGVNTANLINLNVISEENSIVNNDNFDNIVLPSLNVTPIIHKMLNEDNCEENLMVIAEENAIANIDSLDNIGAHGPIDALIGVFDGPNGTIIELVFAVEDFLPLATSGGFNEVKGS
ncbi:hypothetical protein MA16_Dca025884 [Dendrobium catenatum]|uniref:Uncharacterized protein n=1 Tax=Dendrobium catenatum TaxID=906689 RepID=A0A2I0XI51_9ASPA|nr:hypothetical protein MA16_Dca025884 [Dendrobium catenatum]